ncbi:methyltransferase domain-containing protein [Embleya scabrispora]|nr:methyltransferase domain-containing protein [Embleya scabrispora]
MVEGVPVGTAESIPLPEGTVDVVTVTRACHRFEPEPEPALREIARVLRPAGVPALPWNARDQGNALVDRLYEVAECPFGGLRDDRPAVARSPWFERAERTLFRRRESWPMTRAWSGSPRSATRVRWGDRPAAGRNAGEGAGVRRGVRAAGGTGPGHRHPPRPGAGVGAPRPTGCGRRATTTPG